MLRAVTGGTEDHLLSTDGSSELADHIPARPFLDRCPLRRRVVVHGEPVMVLRDGYHEPGSRIAERLRPLPVIEPLGGESADQVLIPEDLLIAVDLPVMLVLRSALHIHVAGIPLITEHRYAVGPPSARRCRICRPGTRRAPDGLRARPNRRGMVRDQWPPAPWAVFPSVSPFQVLRLVVGKVPRPADEERPRRDRARHQMSATVCRLPGTSSRSARVRALPLPGPSIRGSRAAQVRALGLPASGATR